MRREEKKRKERGRISRGFFFLLLKIWIGAWKMCNVSTKETRKFQWKRMMYNLFSFLRIVPTIDALFKSIFFGEFTYWIYIYIYIVEQRVCLSFKTRANTREHFTRSFWNVKDFNLDTRREARKTSRCDWRLGARCSKSWLAWIEARRKQAGFRLKSRNSQSSRNKYAK